ncbi:MAG: TraR/DksA family transcriptional regulator [Burkholderiales bacterium]|nr:TraR/DksA family transcriptional regulator [Burkholderiales bacterium]
MTHLKQTELEQLASQLDRAYAALIVEVRQELAASDQEHFQDIAGRVHDQGEASVADMLADLGAAMIDRHIHEIRDIEAAKRRMQDGVYGVCVDCGADIDLARLNAYPTARRCIECQGVHEKQFAQTGHPSL